MFALQASREQAVNWWDQNTEGIKASAIAAEVEYLKRGSAIVRLHGAVPHAKFDVGPIEISAAAIHALEASDRYVWPLLLRHLQADRSSDIPALTTSAARWNGAAMAANDGRVVSEFDLADSHRLCIITRLGEAGFTTLTLASRVRNPPFAWRVVLVATAFSLPGFLAGGMLGAFLGDFLLWSVVGGLIAAVVGALMEAWPLPAPQAGDHHQPTRRFG